MTNEERDIIAKFIARVGGAAPQQGAWGSGASVPATQPQLPPVDPEADRFIADQFASHPEARYRITQMAFVQEAALAEAQNRLRQLEGARQSPGAFEQVIPLPYGSAAGSQPGGGALNSSGTPFRPEGAPRSGRIEDLF